jgi:hypothetical protein
MNDRTYLPHHIEDMVADTGVTLSERQRAYIARLASIAPDLVLQMQEYGVDLVFTNKTGGTTTRTLPHDGRILQALQRLTGGRTVKTPEGWRLDFGAGARTRRASEPATRRRGAGRPASPRPVASRRSSDRSGSSGDDGPGEPPASRFCAAPGCGRDISHRRADATTCSAVCRKRLERQRSNAPVEPRAQILDFAEALSDAVFREHYLVMRLRPHEDELGTVFGRRRFTRDDEWGWRTRPSRSEAARLRATYRVIRSAA